MSDSKKIIAVFGATGLQGGSVVRALREQGTFRIRAITRDPSKAAGLADEVVAGDLDKPETLGKALEGAHGVFLVTNFWNPGTNELEQGTAAVKAAAAAGVKHFVWSTLPHVEHISGGKFDVIHFTEKAKVDAVVADAGFEAYTFVEAPFYFQNLAGVMAPQPQADGSRAWAMPMAADSKVMHMGDIHELGTLVAGAFAHPARVGSGQHLAHAGGLYSWNDVIETLRSQGHKVGYMQVPNEAFDSFFPGAKELREMMNYFEAHTYFGPDAETKLALARDVATRPPTDLATWARANMPVG